MPRALRIQYPDAWYHVMNRGRRGEKIFETKEDHWSFIDLLEELDEVFNVRVGAYCLMSTTLSPPGPDPGCKSFQIHETFEWCLYTAL